MDAFLETGGPTDYVAAMGAIILIAMAFVFFFGIRISR